MFETVGSLAVIEPVLMLIGLVSLPLLWASMAAAWALVGARRSTVGASTAASVVAIGASFSTFLLAAALAFRLVSMPPGHVLVQHVAQIARLGQLDLSFDLALDARSATFAIVIAVVACASAVYASPRARAERLAWIGAVSAGAMLVCLGDGVPPILTGLGILSIGTWGLARGRDLRVSITNVGGNLGILLGFVFLFWSLGGSFGPEGYDPDGAPRFVLVMTNTPSHEPDKATLAMTTYAGALLSADDADLPNEPVVSPLSIVVPPGVYTLRIQRGAASGDVVVPRVALVPGKTHVLTPYGPTTSLRALDDQIAAPRLAPTGGIAGVRAVLASRTVGGLRASAIVLLLVLGGALCHLYALANRRGPVVLVDVLEAVVAPYLALRLAALVDPSGADGSLVVLLGAGTALVLATRAACEDDFSRALRGSLAATAAVAVVAAGLREPSSVILIVSSSLVATAAALAAVEGRHDVRWLGVACAAAVGLLPGAGSSVGFILAVTAALGSAATGSVGWALFAGVLALVLAATCALSSLAAFRVYTACVERAEATRARGRQTAVVVVLGVAALVGGTVLGVGTTMFGGHVTPFVERLAGPTTIAFTRAMAGAAVVLTLVASVSGLVLAGQLARGPAGTSTAPRWLLSLARPYAVLSWTARGVGEAASFLERSVRAMDREVIEFVPELIASAVLRTAGGVGRVERGIDERVEASLERPALGASHVAAELDVDPRGRERVHTVIVLVMVVLLGLVMLSFLLLA